MEDGRCELRVAARCGSTAGGTVDHDAPRARPARGVRSVHGWGNVVGACGPCNGAKRARSLPAFPLSRRPRRSWGVRLG